MNVGACCYRAALQRRESRAGIHKVLTAHEDALNLPARALDASRHVLRHYGNMSSVTVLFVRQETLRAHPIGRALLNFPG